MEMTPVIDIVGGGASPANPYNRLSAAGRQQLIDLLGPDGALTSAEDLQAYAYDGTFLERRPDLVALPRSTTDVSAVLALASRERVPVVTRGAGSGLAGGSVPLLGGIVLTLTRMDRILELDTVNMLMRVQPGLVTGDLKAEALAHGLFYPPDPASQRQSTIGGNVAMGAGGPHGLKYGPGGGRRRWPGDARRRQNDQECHRLQPHPTAGRLGGDAGGGDRDPAPAAAEAARRAHRDGRLPADR